MKKLLLILMSTIIAGGAMAGTKPFNLSLTPDVAVYDRNTVIEGLTLSIWGENPQTSFALGFVNGSTGQSAGLSLGLLNYAENYRGLQWALVNYTGQDTSGWQGGFGFGIAVSALNYTGGTMKGLQTGVVNYAGKLTGLQLGLVNYAKTADAGVQIGLVNIIPQNEWFTRLPDELAPGMILVNWRF
ncbi:MAG TPA: hypothetical protein PKI68_00635 [Pontiellaceae bacterium]|nr:hypothetical protein [Pontiellaceae bacterium]